MGTKMAPSYANIFMGRLKRRLLHSVNLKPFSWLRFIDDIDMKWTHGKATLEAFLKTANSYIPYSLALRIRRICSDDETFEKRSKDLSEQLKQRGYQKQVIDQAIEKFRHMERQNLLSYKPKPTANKAVLPFVLTYHPDLPKARSIVDKH